MSKTSNKSSPYRLDRGLWVSAAEMHHIGTYCYWDELYGVDTVRGTLAQTAAFWGKPHEVARGMIYITAPSANPGWVNTIGGMDKIVVNKTAFYSLYRRLRTRNEYILRNVRLKELLELTDVVDATHSMREFLQLDSTK